MFSNRAKEVSMENFPDLQQTVSGRMFSRFPVKLWRITNECKTGAISWHKNGCAICINKTDFEKQYLGNSSSSKAGKGGLANSLGSFKTKHFRSFVRQLNMYGFRKMSHSKLRHPTSNGLITPEMDSFYTCLDPHDSINLENNNSHDMETDCANNDVGTELPNINSRSAMVYEYCHPFFQKDHPELLFQVQRPKKKHLDTENLLALAQCAIEDSLLFGNSWETRQGIRLMPGKENRAPEKDGNTTAPRLLHNSEPPTVNLPPPHLPKPVGMANIYPLVPVSTHDINVIQDSWSEQSVRSLARSNDHSATIMMPTVCSGYISAGKKEWLSSLPMDHGKAICQGPSIDTKQAFFGKEIPQGRFCYDQFYQRPLMNVGQVTATLNTGPQINCSYSEEDANPNYM